MGIGLVMYGAGKRCIGLYKVLTSLGITILLIVDSDNKKWGTKIGSILIESPEKMRAYPNEKVCITVADRSVFVEIKQLLQDKYRYREENIISYNKLIVEAYYNSALIKNLLEAEIQQKSEISILFDCINGLGLGGVEAWTLDLCKALAEDCESYEYIITDSKQYSISNALAKHILSADINHEERFSVDTIECLVKIILGKMPCKVVTSLTNEMLLAAYLVKQKYPNMVGVISVIHNGIEGIYLEHLEFKECIDLFIGVSHDIRRDMIQRGIVPDKIYSMTCPFTCEEILTRTYTENRDSPICIGYAGRIEYEQKRMDLLLKFVELLVNRKVNFKMELAGDGLAKEEMEEFIKEKHLEIYIMFLGKICREEIAEFWKKQDISINLSDFEGHSISQLEAMANGAVPIVTVVSGSREDIANDVNGYIVPIGDYKSAADKVEFLERHREKLAEMGKKAHDEVYPKSLMEPHLAFWKKILYGT